MYILVRVWALALLLVTGLASGSAYAQSATPPLTLPPNGPVQQQDFPCAIVLCVLKPSAEDCGPPIHWLIKNFIEKGRPWPTCNFGGASNASVSYTSEQHVACPSGFTSEQASTDNGGNVLTGVCLRPVSTCATTGPQAYQPSVPGAACYTYTTYNDNGYAYTQYFEYVIPSSGVTSYTMTVQTAATSLAPASNNTFFFNLGGSAGGDLAASIINSNANNNSSAYGGSGGGGD